MGGWLSRSGPLVASAVGHLGLLAVLAGAGLVAGPASPPSTPVPVGRAADSGAAPSPRLRLETTARTESVPEAPAGAVVALDTADPRYRPYLAGVKRRIWERWSAPDLPAGPPARGVLVVEFTLTRSGRLAASEVRETSGVPALDLAALDAVARAVPFTPLPPSIGGESMRVRARFVYD